MKRARFVAFSCTHCPYQSEDAIDNLIKEIKGRKITHALHLGDVIEGKASSQWKDDPTQHSLHDEYLCASDMLKRIRKALPSDCELVAMDGNHDDNVQKAGRIQHDLRSLLDPRNLDGIKDEFKRWKHVPYRHGKIGTYRLGNVIFTHGFSTNDEMEAIQLAQDCHGMLANQLVVRGHTHRPVPPTQCKKSQRVKLPLWYANAGYMAFGDGAKRAPYTYRFSISAWKHGAIFGECQLGRVGRMGRDSWNAELVLL
ncbi:MAG: hypothetical protein CL524_08335 [Aequorivita sp.]|nr:hypothetical protein [Aequorivita sp.]